MSNKKAETYAKMFCKADDTCLEKILDPVLGYKTHRSPKEPMQNIDCVPKMMRDQEKIYENSLRKNSRIEYARCDRYPNDKDWGTKVIAKQRLNMGTRIPELYARYQNP